MMIGRQARSPGWMPAPARRAGGRSRPKAPVILPALALLVPFFWLYAAPSVTSGAAFPPERAPSSALSAHPGTGRAYAAQSALGALSAIDGPSPPAPIALRAAARPLARCAGQPAKCLALPGEQPSPRVWLPMAAQGWQTPKIAFTYVPPYGSLMNLRGQVLGLSPGAYAVAVYIRVGSGWWTKPRWNAPLTPIQADGSWVCDITTGGIDEQATEIAAFVVPKDVVPPKRGGEPELPQALYETAVAHTSVERQAVHREIVFSGYTWAVKASSARVGPGSNYFSDREEDVWVDDRGRLHLRIAQHENRWYSTEVIAGQSLGYGTYVFRISGGPTGRVDQFDPYVVLGLFTWDSGAPADNYREIDIEFSRWGDPLAANAQYVVQPWTTPGNRYRFEFAPSGDPSTHCFDWAPERVAFRSYDGFVACPGSGENALAAWTYTGPEIPPPGDENPRINLWLHQGAPPSDGQSVEVTIDKFEYDPAP